MNVLHYTDDQRAEQLLIAVEAGAACVDMQGYTFYGSQDTKPTLITEYRGEHMSFVDACPEEVCLCPETIKKQMSFVDRVHSMGAEVLLSTHVGCFLKCEQVLDLLDFLKVRNPDVIKLVGMGCDTDEDLVEYFKTLTEIKKRYTDVKIHYHIKFLEPLFAGIFSALILGENIWKWEYLIAILFIGAAINISCENGRKTRRKRIHVQAE